MNLPVRQGKEDREDMDHVFGDRYCSIED